MSTATSVNTGTEKSMIFIFLQALGKNVLADHIVHRKGINKPVQLKIQLSAELLVNNSAAGWPCWNSPQAQVGFITAANNRNH